MSEREALLHARARARVATLFFGFGVSACVVVVVGLLLALLEGAALAAFSWPSPRRLAQDVVALSPDGVLSLGLFLLLLLPLVRNTSVMVALLRQGKRTAALLALVVIIALAALYLSLSLTAA